MMKVGSYGTEGFVIGLLSLIGQVKKVGSNVGNAAVDSLNTAMSKVAAMLSTDLDAAPTIRPILDVSSIENSLGTVDRLFSATRTLDLSGTRVKAATVVHGMLSRYDDSVKAGGTLATTANYNFTQNNYSPKALSRIEIYRQTNNLFSTTKEVLSRA